jgi:hypothetical protein
MSSQSISRERGRAKCFGPGNKHFPGMDGSKVISPHVRTKTFHVDLYHWHYFMRLVQCIQQSPGGNRWDLAKAQLAKPARVTKHEQRPNVNIFDDLRTLERGALAGQDGSGRGPGAVAGVLARSRQFLVVVCPRY